jgi:Verrucomicrobium spinosum paralogous family TIGR02597
MFYRPLFSRLPAALALSLGIALFAASGNAQTVVTDPVGFTSTSCLSNSDTLVSIPFTRPQAFVGAAASVAGGTITVSGSPGWTTNQFVYAPGTQPNHYYALIGAASTSNPKEGHTYTITANTANTVTVDVTSDSLTGIPTNAQVVIIPYWTLATVYPATNAGVSFTATTQTRTFQTQLLIPNYNATGINPSAAAIYFFSNNVNGDTNNGIGWRIVGDNMTDHGDDVLIPDGYFIVRNLNNAPTLPLTAVGGVLTKKLAVPELTNAASGRDNSVSMVRPVNVALNVTGLNPADNSFVATTQTRTLQDQLFVFDNTTVALNKSPSAIYIYGNNLNGDTNNGIGWRIVGDNMTDHGGDLIPSGSALIIRKAANGTGLPVYWTNAPTY